MRVQSGAKLDIPGAGTLHLEKGTVELPGQVILDFGANAKFIQTVLVGQFDKTIILGTDLGNFNLSASTVTSCVDCIDLMGGIGMTSVVGTTFNDYSGNALTVKNRSDLKINGACLFDADPFNLPEDAVRADNVGLVRVNAKSFS